LEREYGDLVERVFDKTPSKFPKDKYTLELFLWAFVMLFSRAARLSLKIGGEELALVPYADLMNHNPYSNTYIDAQRSGMPLISRTEEVAVYSDRNYKKFEQVFINYGEKGNGDLLLLYGFALERNPFNSVDITVGLSREDPMYGQKKAFLDSSGRGASSVRFPLQQNRYPSELVDFLRLLLVEPEDLGMQQLDRVDFNEPISPSLERRVLTTMVSICESYLEQYPTKVEEDEALMRDRQLFGALSRQQRMAVKVSHPSSRTR
jgi:histone-lysine N-methyltransferase SETD3